MTKWPATLYARLEPSSDSVVQLYVSEKSRKLDTWKDVVLYHDEACTKLAGIIPASYKSSRPRKNQKSIMHNCARYNLVWVAAPEKLEPITHEERVSRIRRA